MQARVKQDFRAILKQSQDLLVYFCFTPVGKGQDIYIARHTNTRTMLGVNLDAQKLQSFY